MFAKRSKSKFTPYLFALALILSLPTKSFAGGFALYEYAARANAMGGAVIALADDPSAVAYNPAGMTQLPGTQTMVGATAIVPIGQVKHGNTGWDTTHTNVYLPPHAFLTHQLNDRAWFGVGLFSRFGVGTQYDSDWGGAGNIYKADLMTFSVAPNLAYKITDSLSVSGGVELLYSQADLRKKLPPGVAFGGRDMRMNVSGLGVGAQLGLHYILNEQWSAGFTYHTTQKHTDKGNVRYLNIAGAGTTRDGNIEMSLDLPASYTLGVAYKPNKQWKLEADLIFTQWQDYDKLTYDFEYRPGAGVPGTQVNEKNWRNVWRVQLGGEYMAQDWLALRAGFVWDQDPIRKGYEDYMLPSSDRKIYSVGFGILDGKFNYDFSLMYLMNNHRSIDSVATSSTASAPGEIKDSRAYMAGFSIGYKF